MTIQNTSRIKPRVRAFYAVVSEVSGRVIDQLPSEIVIDMIQADASATKPEHRPKPNERTFHANTHLLLEEVEQTFGSYADLHIEIATETGNGHGVDVQLVTGVGVIEFRPQKSEVLGWNFAFTYKTESGDLVFEKFERKT